MSNANQRAEKANGASQKGSSGGPSGESEQTITLETVREEERGSLHRRREQVGLRRAVPSEAGDPDRPFEPECGPVGVALSGGGLRSACFGLGVTQAFLQTGLWRYVDYLSTVSGGGYIGSYLSSYVIHTQKKVTELDCPLLSSGDNKRKHSPDVQRFIHGGHYLVKPWRLANRYLIGLVFLNTFLFSGVVAMCSLVAFAWRSLDYDAFRTWILAFGIEALGTDALTPFLPFLFFLLLWVAAWIVSFFRRGLGGKGRVARSLLLFAVSSLLIGIAILFGNGDADLSFLFSSPTAEPWRPSNTLWASLAGLTMGGLLPFFTPKRLIQSGLRPANMRERVVFLVASSAALIGVPLLILGFLAQENISGFNSNPHRPTGRGDIQNVPALIGMLAPFKWFAIDDGLLEPGDQSNGADSAVDVNGDEGSDSSQATENSSDAVPDNNNDPYEDNPLATLMRSQFVGKLGEAETWGDHKELNEYGERWKELLDMRGGVTGSWGNWCDRKKNLLDELPNTDEEETGEGDTDNPSDKTLQRRRKLLIACDVVEQVWQSERDRYFGLDRYVHHREWLGVRVGKLWRAGLSVIGPQDLDNSSLRIRLLANIRIDLSDRLASEFDRSVLQVDLSDDPTRHELLSSLLDQYHRRQVGADTSESNGGDRISTRRGVHGDVGPRKRESLRPADMARVQRMEVLARSALTEDVRKWPDHQRNELTVMLLEWEFPNIFRIRSEPQRRTTHGEDQKTRIAWFLGSLSVFLLMGFFLNLNAMSVHSFYRSRLMQAFIVPQRGRLGSPPLSCMHTTDLGAPYHLISATSGVVRDRSGYEDLPAGQHYSPGEEPIHRVVDSFLFSQLYCGSQITGYVRTEAYEQMIRGERNELDLAEAIAISGAAISPGHVRNWLVATLMFSLNLRLGQWLPNPRRGRPGWAPTPLQLLPDWFRPVSRRSYCFLSDGGNSENLGLIQLLRRRCSLIIQVDASQDPNHEFADLGRAIRMARVHGGVRLARVDRPDLDFTTESLELRKLAPREEGSTEQQANCANHYAAAKIIYPDDSVGYLIYIKPSFTGDESTDLQQYRRHNPSFPHEPTSDQFYDMEQAESYRQLGYHIAMDLCRPLIDRVGKADLTTDELRQLLIPESVAHPTPGFGKDSVALRAAQGFWDSETTDPRSATDTEIERETGSNVKTVTKADPPVSQEPQPEEVGVTSESRRGAAAAAGSARGEADEPDVPRESRHHAIAEPSGSHGGNGADATATKVASPSGVTSDQHEPARRELRDLLGQLRASRNPYQQFYGSTECSQLLLHGLKIETDREKLLDVIDHLAEIARYQPSQEREIRGELSRLSKTHSDASVCSAARGTLSSIREGRKKGR